METRWLIEFRECVFLVKCFWRDGTALVADSTELLQSLVTEFVKIYKRMKFRVNVEQSKAKMLWSESTEYQAEVEIFKDIMGLVCSLQYFGSSFNKGRGPQENMQLREGEELKAFAAE